MYWLYMNVDIWSSCHKCEIQESPPVPELGIEKAVCCSVSLLVESIPPPTTFQTEWPDSLREVLSLSVLFFLFFRLVETLLDLHFLLRGILILHVNL